MSGPSKIQWTEATWNPVTGCSKVSPGCDRCYAETFAERWCGIPGHPYEQGFDLKLWPERLDVPRHWRKPRLIFVNSMSDLFHARVPYEFVERVWETMATASQHTYQILTKRPDRMQRFVSRLVARFGVLPNVWLGTSIESQEYIGRAAHLSRTPAAVRFLSCEPLLGPLDLSSMLPGFDCPTCRAAGGGFRREVMHGPPALHWVIVGGESGPGARVMDLEWARGIQRDCREAGVACYVKQLGVVWAREAKATDRKHGGNPDEWPVDLRVREMPGRAA
jgi:protein gp37